MENSKPTKKELEFQQGKKTLNMFQLFESILSGNKKKIQKYIKSLKENENLLTEKEQINLYLAQFELNDDINQFLDSASKH